MPLKFTCKQCGKDNYSKYLKPGEEFKCRHCGQTAAVPADAQTTEEMPAWTAPQRESGSSNERADAASAARNRFPMLSSFASIITVLGWILLVLSPVAFLIPVLSESHDLAVALRSGLGALFSALASIAGGQAIRCLIAVEENARGARQHLAEIARLLAHK